MPKLPNSRNIFGVLLILGNSVQYFLDGFPTVIVLSSLALEACPGMGFPIAAQLPPYGKKSAAGAALFLFGFLRTYYAVHDLRSMFVHCLGAVDVEIHCCFVAGVA